MLSFQKADFLRVFWGRKKCKNSNTIQVKKKINTNYISYLFFYKIEAVNH